MVPLMFWSNGYYAVYHLNNVAAGVPGEFINSASSTSNARGYGTSQPIRVTSQLGYAQSFVAGKQSIYQRFRRHLERRWRSNDCFILDQRLRQWNL